MIDFNVADKQSFFSVKMCDRKNVRLFSCLDEWNWIEAALLINAALFTHLQGIVGSVKCPRFADDEKRNSVWRINRKDFLSWLKNLEVEVLRECQKDFVIVTRCFCLRSRTTKTVMSLFFDNNSSISFWSVEYSSDGLIKCDWKKQIDTWVIKRRCFLRRI